MVLATIVLAGCGGGADEGSGGMAEVMCEEFVKDRLKSPSSAEFSDQAHEQLGGADQQRWEVTGVVDSENSFGAMLRMTYKCDLTYEGDSEWSADLVDVRE